MTLLRPAMDSWRPKPFKSVEFLTIRHVLWYIQYDKRKKNENIGAQKLVKNGWTYFHTTELKIFLTFDTAKNSPDLNRLDNLPSIAGLERVIAHREGGLPFIQSWQILKKPHLRREAACKKNFFPIYIYIYIYIYMFN